MLQGYLNHLEFAFPDKDRLLKSVNAYMTEYAAREAAQARLQTQLRHVPDNEGFITVTRGGRTDPLKQEVAQAAVSKQKEKKKGLDNFYRFQVREKRKIQAKELMKRFEEDKEKVRKMRDSRGVLQVSYVQDPQLQMLMNLLAGLSHGISPTFRHRSTHAPHT